MKRRDFITTSTALAAGGLLSACNDNNRRAIDYSKIQEKKEKKLASIHVNYNKKVTLKLATSWPAHFPIMGTGVENFVQRVNTASGGSLEIKLYPKNTLIPALAVFDACSSGEIDIFHSGPYYWKGKNSAFSLFSGMPFGMTSEEINAWMHFGGGYELWRELYAKYNLYPMLGGNTNIQMGGWFRKEIKELNDLNGLKMRVPGLGGEVFAKLGVNPILLPAGEIYTALERGVIDATEWVGPYLDMKMGFYKVAPYYYSGWHEPGSILELSFNKERFSKLSIEHRAILEMASEEMNAKMTYEFQAKNSLALSELKGKGVILKSFPSDVISAAKKGLIDVVKYESAKNSDFKEVYKSASSFLNASKSYSDVSLKKYLTLR
ncbi:TRAP transporter substrate-binding protein DctP [Sulfurimonas sp. MAG313]|nr:TRAP transporter substrate-binding protein DctP [Sulfurimonas sp. MAG313]MDF1881394.1 TRAP transporter substrate-binding protein DctP [Sulfurimonas sp. MAG313]